MFDKVVVGIDGFSGGRDALALAKLLAAGEGALTLTHVYIESQLPARGSMGVYTEGERRTSHDLLEQARAELAPDAKIAAIPSHFVGRGLHELAERLPADLIVVGSSHRGRLGRVFLGDEMRSALNGAPCPVAIAPSGFADRPAVLHEIGVGYDEMPESRYALSVGRDLAAERGARISVFEAVPLPTHGFGDARHPSRETMEAEVEHARERLAGLGGVEPHAALGDPAEELALYGASVDLLVIGSRGYGPVGRMLHGHTSLTLAGTARCPLLILNRRAVMTQPGRDGEKANAAGAHAG